MCARVLKHLATDFISLQDLGILISCFGFGFGVVVCGISRCKGLLILTEQSYSKISLYVSVCVCVFPKDIHQAYFLMTP